METSLNLMSLFVTEDLDRAPTQEITAYTFNLDTPQRTMCGWEANILMMVYKTGCLVLEWIKLARDSPVEGNRLHNPTGLLKVQDFLDLLSDSWFSAMSIFYRSRWYSFKLQDIYIYIYTYTRGSFKF